MTDLAQTPLHDWHVGQGARMVDFAGWSMPVQYTSIVAEHQATRKGVSLFDISHMGRLRFDGVGAEAFLDRLLTRSVRNMRAGRIRYSLVTSHDGGILDDVLAYHLEQPSGKRYFMLVVNASNRLKIVDWIQQQLTPEDEVEISDRTKQTAMIAVQGPLAVAIADPLVEADITGFGYYTGQVSQQMGKPCIASRTGYTGEDGVELIVKSEDAVQVWNNLMAAGRAHNIVPAGLGARDTLRLEAAMPLYGHELTETIDPLTAGLGFAVNLSGRDFIGRDALANKNDHISQARVGLELAGRRVPREHYPVFAGDRPVGEITSGTFSPTLEKPIAMAYVATEVANVGTELMVDIRGTLLPAKVVELPFYKRS